MADTYTPTAPSSFPTTISVPATTDPVTGGVGGAANVAGEDNADNIQWLYEQRFEDFKDRIENESGGHLTAREDDNGTVDIFYVVNQFCPDWLSGEATWDAGSEHRAFYENGTIFEKLLVSIVNARAATVDGVLTLIQSPTESATVDTMANFRTRVANKGSDYHIMTCYEYGALCLQAHAVVNGRMHGNTDGGRYDIYSITNQEYGSMVSPGSNTYTLPGSGPLAWRHNLTPWGVCDLVGNYDEFIEGIKTVGTQIVMMGTDNDYTNPEGSWTSTGIYYKDNGSGNIVLDTSGATSLALFNNFQDIALTSTLLAASNPYANSILCDAMISPQFENAGVAITPSVLGNVSGRVSLSITSGTEENYYKIGGDYTSQSNGGAGARLDGVTTSTTGTCRFCLLE